MGRFWDQRGHRHCVGGILEGVRRFRRGIGAVYLLAGGAVAPLSRQETIHCCRSKFWLRPTRSRSGVPPVRRMGSDSSSRRRMMFRAGTIARSCAAPHKVQTTRQRGKGVETAYSLSERRGFGPSNARCARREARQKERIVLRAPRRESCGRLDTDVERHSTSRSFRY